MKSDELLDLQQYIADEAARGDIESFLSPDPSSGPETGWWYDITTGQPEHKEWVDRAMCYLELRGLLKRHPKNPNMIRPLSSEKESEVAE